MFKLALQLGKTVNELSDELSNDELIEWIAYDRIDPFGNYRMDAQFAQVLKLAAEWMGGESMPLKDYLFVDPHPVSPEVAAEREREAEIERLRAETEAMTKMLFDEDKAKAKSVLDATINSLSSDIVKSGTIDKNW